MSQGMTAIQEGFWYLLEGAWVNLVVVAGALIFGFLLGLPLALGQVYGGKILRRIFAVYVWFFRGIPLLVFLFLFYFGLVAWLDVNLSAFTVAVIVLGLISAAYQSQTLRGALLSIPEGQMKAARALGMSDFQAIFRVILPQSIRLSIPGWSNEYAILLKDSAVTYALGVSELMSRTNHVASRTYQHLYLYITAGILFMILTYAGTRLMGMLQKRLTVPGYTR
ncbi:MAG: amino acid ABC transporter permease [Desulfatirhabdiaceae bacterium]